MTDRHTIAVAGAGIAGLGASIAITLAGLTCKTHEREAEIRAIGAGIQLGPTATRILKRWGVALPEAACAPDHIELRNAVSGKPLNSIPLGRQFEERYGAPYRTLLRTDLQGALLDRARQIGCDLELASPVKLMDQSRGCVQIQAGAALYEVSAFIGADGVGSATRAAISSTNATRSSIIIWRMLIPGASLPAPLRNQVTVWMGDGAHLVHYPVSGGDRINVVLAADSSLMNLSGADGETTAPPRSLISAWATVPRTALESGTHWTEWPVLTVSRWKGGTRFVQTIGDAWHAMPPFLASGAVMAIEDADALAKSLNESPGRVIQGLERFREIRAARVWRVWAQSHQMGRIYHLGLPFASARDLALRSMPSQALLKRNDWLYAPQG